MAAFNVSDSIGFDGRSYYCRRCGRAGYRKATQVRGHLAMCPGTMMRKGVSPTTSYNWLPSGNGAGLQNLGANYLQPVTGASGGDLGGSQLQPLEVVVGPSYEQLDRRISAMENEYQHLLQQRNQPAESWFNKNMALILLGGIILIALFSSMTQSCQCPTGESRTRRGPDMAKLSERVINKAADVAITKGFGRVFS